MKKRSYLIRRCLIMLVVVLLLVCICDSSAEAARKPVLPQEMINEEDRSWSGWPWLVGMILVGGTMAIGLKNAKRTHLD